VASFTQLLTAQQQAQQTRIELIADQAQRLIDSVALYQAMGGGVLVDTAVAQSPSAQTPGDVPQR
jgi:outer membrane protein TolC